MAISIYRGTTPTLSCILPTELTDKTIAEVWLTFKFINKQTLRCDQIDYYLSKGNLTLKGNLLSLRFTQEDTLRFKPVDYKLDIRLLLNNGNAMALKTKKIIHIIDVLKNGVIESDGIGQNEIIPVILSDNNNMEFKTLFNDIQQTFDVGLNAQTVISGDYNDLLNKPQINGVVLEGNKTFADLHFTSLQPDQIEDIWNEL